MKLKDGRREVSAADIVLFMFLEFVHGFHGRDVCRVEGMWNRRKFYKGFMQKMSVRRGAGETFPEGMMAKAREWDPQAM